MKLYLADIGVQFRALHSRGVRFDEANILQSYFYCDEFTTQTLIPDSRSFMLDSGAFTFIRDNSDVDWARYVDEYSEFINCNGVELFFELDIDALIGLAEVDFGKSGLIAWVGIASVLANIVTAKSAVIFGLDATLGTVLFASTFLATDILSECYSKKDAKSAVWLGLFSVSTFIIATQIALLYIPSQFDYANASMETLFSLNLQISLASMLMYFLSNMGDVLIFNRMKEKTGGRYLWLRNNLSTMLCNCLENFGFIFLAFWGVYPVEELIVIAASTSIIEIVVAACDTPFLYIAKHVKELRFRRKVYGDAVES